MSIETKICEVSVDELRPFKDHPYKVIDDGSMTDLAESIRERGVIAGNSTGAIYTPFHGIVERKIGNTVYFIKNFLISASAS